MDATNDYRWTGKNGENLQTVLGLGITFVVLFVFAVSMLVITYLYERAHWYHERVSADLGHKDLKLLVSPQQAYDTKSWTIEIMSARSGGGTMFAKTGDQTVYLNINGYTHRQYGLVGTLTTGERIEFRFTSGCNDVRVYINGIYMYTCIKESAEALSKDNDNSTSAIYPIVSHM